LATLRFADVDHARPGASTLGDELEGDDDVLGLEAEVHEGSSLKRRV